MSIIMPGIKPKESSFFPDSMAGEQVIKLFDSLLRDVDITKIKAQGGKVEFSLDSGLGFRIRFRINQKTGLVQTAYPFISPWKNNPLLKKIYCVKKES